MTRSALHHSAVAALSLLAISAATTSAATYRVTNLSDSGPGSLRQAILDAAGGSHRLDSDGSCGFLGPDDLPSTDPRLAPLSENGGPTPTHALLLGSPAIDAANDGLCPTADQRGVIRPQDGDGDGAARCDIGAYEREVATGPCTATPEALCLSSDRFEVLAQWRDFEGKRGAGAALRLTDETGYFWFFQPDNVEVVVKVLDACGLVDRYWVFVAGLTNVEVTLRVRDSVAGVERVYSNLLGETFVTILDTDAFATCP